MPDAIKIHKYNKEGIYLDTYDSLLSASRDSNIKSAGSISRALDTTWQAGGFMWRSYKKKRIPKYQTQPRNMRKVVVGNTYVSEIYGEYTVMSFSHNDPQGRKHFNVHFKNTHYEDSFDSNTIMNGKAKDYFYPSVHGVGYLGSKKRDYNKKAKKLWDGIINRCYGNHIHSKNYKDAGVTVSARWLNFTYFLEDLTLIDGYDENLFKEGKLDLDKDLKQKDIYKDKIYSLETCTFMTSSANSKLVDRSNAVGVDFVALSPEGILYTGNNISKFSREQGLGRSQLLKVLHSQNRHTYKGWSIGPKYSSLAYLSSEQSLGRNKYYKKIN